MRGKLLAVAAKQYGGSGRLYRAVGHKQQNRMVGAVFDDGPVGETDLNPTDVMAIGEYAARGGKPVGAHAAAEKRTRSTAGQALAISDLYPARQRPGVLPGLEEERKVLPVIPDLWTGRVGLPDRRVIARCEPVTASRSTRNVDRSVVTPVRGLRSSARTRSRHQSSAWALPTRSAI
jgi:hypothetical protein